MKGPEITLVEVGPRDGLQNEPKNIPTELKIAFINALALAGLKYIETTSFVSPKWVPQMADHTAVAQGITRYPGVHYSALVPNIHGLEDAFTAKIPEIAVFTAASETFSAKNTNCSIEESLHRVAEVIEQAQAHQIPVRGYISCVFGCPYEGEIPLASVIRVAEHLLKLGCYQISFGDTLGVSTAQKTKTLIETIKRHVPLKQIAVHFHDTYAQALTNIYVSLAAGITVIDSAASGLGGCPYAPGAGGNVATEDVLYLLQGLGIHTGIDLLQVAKAGQKICAYLQQPPRSKVALALLSRNSE